MHGKTTLKNYKDLTLNLVFILELGQINLPRYARKEFLTVIYGCGGRGGGTTQMAIAIVKKSE
jgi:hypothetical protein